MTSFQGKVNLLPINKEKYIFFTKNIEKTNVKLRFIDSFRFMPSSLEKLALFLNNDEKIITKRYCDPNLPGSYIIYFDINNQYGAAMSEFLPYRNFEWVEDYLMIDFLNIPDNSSVGLMPNSKCKILKLMTTLLPPKNYIVHHRNFKLYLSLGVK